MNSRFSSLSDNLGIHLPPVLKLEMLFFFFQRVSVYLHIQEFVPGKQNSMEFNDIKSQAYYFQGELLIFLLSFSFLI